jgi:hypothetical protein
MLLRAAQSVSCAFCHEWSTKGLSVLRGGAFGGQLHHVAATHMPFPCESFHTCTCKLRRSVQEHVDPVVCQVEGWLTACGIRWKHLTKHSVQEWTCSCSVVMSHYLLVGGWAWWPCTASWSPLLSDLRTPALAEPGMMLNRQHCG